MLFTFALYTEDQTAGSAKSFSGAYRKAASCFFSPAFNISQPIAFFNYLFIKPDAVVCKMDPDCTRVFFPICYCNLALWFSCYYHAELFKIILLFGFFTVMIFNARTEVLKTFVLLSNNFKGRLQK